MPYLERDGVKLYYEESGAGDSAMLLIHGWTCNHTHWAAQVAHFAPTHRVVSIDLRGHGESDAPEQEYTLEGFADDVAWMIGELGLDRPVVCGHSMGGFVTVMLGKNHPECLRARIIVDSPVLPLSNMSSRRALVDRLLQADYLGPATDFIAMMFNEFDTAETREKLTAEMLTTPLHVLASAWQSIVETDTAGATAANDGPLLAIFAGRFPVNLTEMQALVPSVLVGQTVGSGHFNLVEVPDQVNAMMERFLAKCVD